MFILHLLGWIAYVAIRLALLTFIALAVAGEIKRHRRNRFFPKSRPDSKPGAGWTEVFMNGSEAAETSFISSAASDIQQVQKQNRKRGKAGRYRRAFHAKKHAGIANARLRVVDNIPDVLRVGFLQPGNEYDAIVRLSNASGIAQPDTDKDLRGLAARVLLDEGVKHDFLGTNGSVNHAADAYEFIEFAKAMAGSKLLLLPRLLYNVGPVRTFQMLKTVIKQGSRKVGSLAEETYFSRAPYSFGGLAVRFQFAPVTSAEPTAPGNSEDYLREEIRDRLRKGPVTFELQVQLFKSEAETPIENGSRPWTTPLITIAELVIPQQDLDSPEALDAASTVDELEFNPWNCAEQFRPLGSLNRARNVVYKSSVALRKDGDGKLDEDVRKKWRPKSSRQGIGPLKYVYWNAFYFVLQSLNTRLSRNPYRKVSWDKWPVFIGIYYLLAKIRYNRSNALTDPYDYQTNDTRPRGAEPKDANRHIAADGSYVSDRENPQMGAPNTRFGSNIPPMKVRPDVEEMSPSARDAGRLRWRRIDPVTGEEVTIPALILNDMAGWWIQFQFHGFGGNTKRNPVGVCPHMMKRRPEENWPDNVATIERTTTDPTRPNHDGRPTPVNERTHAWIQAQLYGTDETELKALRSFEQGKLRLDEKGHLPEDPAKPGIDLTGFNQNYSPGLSFLHWLFVMEHNAIADHYAYFHPDWDDEELFQMARKVNVAQIARIHTIQWTEDLLQHPALQVGMHADWYGFLGQRLKMYLMRLADRNKLVDKLLRFVKSSDVVWGMPGSKWEHHDGPFQVPKQFRMVYRLHEMVLSVHEIIEPGTNRTLDRIGLIDFVHNNTRPIVERFGYEVLANSFVKKSAGALTLHNFPRALTQFKNQQDGNLTDLAERDLMRERTDGTGTYNEFRESLGEKPVTSFMELTGGDAELAKELEVCYGGDVNKVDAGIGILAEPKPDGFALGFCQFYQFVLNAPRRVKSNRHLTERFTYADYLEGMDWVEHGGGMLGAMERHLPALRPDIEGIERAFAPWPEAEKFPKRQMNKTHADTQNVFKADLRTLLLAVLASVAGISFGVLSTTLATILLALLVVVPLALAARRMLAMRFMDIVWKKCYTDKRGFYFGTLTRAEDSINRASFFGRIHGGAVVGISLLIALITLWSSPLTGALWIAVALSGLGTSKWSRRFAQDAHVLKISLRNRMRQGQPEVTTDSLSGETDFARRYALSAEVPTILAHPTCVSNQQVYHGIDAEAGSRAKAGNVDLGSVDRIFRKFAPGRDYLTAYDFARLHEAETIEEGGSLVSQLIERFNATRRSTEMLHIFGDRVVEEDKRLVPAISKSMLIRFYQGLAQAEIKREREEGDQDPSDLF